MAANSFNCSENISFEALSANKYRLIQTISLYKKVCKLINNKLISLFHNYFGLLELRPLLNFSDIGLNRMKNGQKREV